MSATTTMTPMMTPATISTAAPNTAQLAAASMLQTVLAKLVSLTLDAKQAHWNVTGPAFVDLHARTDELAADLRVWTDRIAERAVALGSPVDARPATVAHAAVQPLQTGWLSGHETIVELTERIDDIRATIDAMLVELEHADAVGHDAIVEILEGLDRYRWMLVAQIH